VLPYAAIGSLTLLLLLFQLSWLGELRGMLAARQRETLEAATRQASDRLDLDLARRVSSGGDPGPGFVVDTGETREPWALVRLRGSGARGWLVVDSGYAVGTLFPDLAREISTLSGTSVDVAIARVSDGDESLAFAAGELPSRPADADLTLFALAVTGGPPDLGPATWTFFGREGEASEASPWRLRAWVRRGALEDAIRGTGYGSVALAVATTLLLAIAAAYAVAQSRRAEAAATVRAAMLAGISHELRTPLSVIRSAAENLDGGLVDAKSAIEYGQLIGREADRLIDSVEATLRLARGAANGEGATSELVLIDQLLTAAAHALEEDHRITIRGQRDAALRGDREALRVAITNLLSNALRYSPAQTPIELRVDVSANEIAVRVADQGPGFASGERELVFEPFQRGRAGASSPKGAGLGLTLVREIARAHGGRVTVADGRSGGSVVSLHLPTDP